MDLEIMNLPRSSIPACPSKYDSREFQPSPTTYNNNYQLPVKLQHVPAGGYDAMQFKKKTKSDLASADFQTARSTNANSTTTQTKPLDYIEELTDFIYVLTPFGQILYASNAVTELLNYQKDDVVGHNVMEFIHPADVEDYVQAFNDSITNRVGFHNYHRFQKDDGNGLILETTGHAIFDDAKEGSDAQGNAESICKCFVLTARPYPSQAVSELDHCLELKLEFELLKKELRDLGETEINLDEITIEEETSESGSTIKPLTSGQTAMVDFPKNAAQGQHSNSSFTYRKTNSRDTLNTQRKENGSSTTTTKDINRTMNAVHDRCSSSDEFVEPSLSLEEAALDFAKRKKGKKPRAGQIEHKCTDCGRTESPEWRKGIHGPKTLCNACGLRYSKRQKKIAALSLSLNAPNDAYATSRGGRSQSSDSGHDNALMTPTSAFATIHRGGYAPDGVQFYPGTHFLDETSDSSHLTSPMMHDPSYPPPSTLQHFSSNSSTSTSMNPSGYPDWR